MKKIILAAAVVFLSINASFPEVKSVSLISDVYSMVEFKLKRYFPKAEMTISRKNREEMNEVENRGKDRLDKAFILPGYTEIVSIDVKDDSNKMLNPVDNSKLPLSYKVEFYVYEKPEDAQKNFNYLDKTPRWIEKGHGEVKNCIDVYCYRVVSLGPDKLLNDVNQIVSYSIRDYLKMMEIVNKK